MIHRPRKRLDLGEPGHHRRSIERDEAGQVVEHELRRGVRVPEQHLRVGERQGRIEERQDPHGVHPADRRDDRPHRRVREGRVQVVGPGPRVGAELSRGSPGTRHLANLEPEHCAAARRARGRTRAGTRSGRPTTSRRRPPCRRPGAAAAGRDRAIRSPRPRPRLELDDVALGIGHVRPGDAPAVGRLESSRPRRRRRRPRRAPPRGPRPRRAPRTRCARSPGRLIAVGRPLRHRSELVDLERRAVRRRVPAGGDARRGAWRPARRSRPRGPGRRVVALGRHEDAAEDALVEVGERPPVARR